MSNASIVDEWFASRAPKPNIVSGTITAVGHDLLTGRPTYWNVNVADSTVRVPLDLLAPALAVGDAVRLQQDGSAAAATYHVLNAAGAHGTSGTTQFFGTATVGPSLGGVAQTHTYAAGDIVFGDLAGGNIFIEYSTGNQYHRVGASVNGIEYANGTQVFGHCALSGSTYYPDGPNVYITASGIQIRTGSTVSLAINASGGISFVTEVQISSALNSTRAIVATAQSPYTIAASDYMLFCNATAGSILLKLPGASSTGRTLNIKKTDSGSCMVAIAGSTGNTIDNEAVQYLNTMESLTLIDYAANLWAII
jgi:hypothetical protein